MKNNRRLLSAIIKLLILLGLLLILGVLVNSLFVERQSNAKTSKLQVANTFIDIADMAKGQVRKVRWNNKEVAVLLRQFPEKLVANSSESTSENDLHPSLDKNLRSATNDYFVYFNTGDSNNCPLYYSGGEFRDVCSSNKFDEAGRALKGNGGNFSLSIPPHFFDNDTLVIGQWQANK